MIMVDIRLNIETLPPLEPREFYLLRQFMVTKFKVGIGCFRLLLSFQSQRLVFVFVYFIFNFIL